LKVIMIGRISTVHQHEESIAASFRYVEDYLHKAYDGDMAITPLGEQASGMLVDRMTILQAEELINTGEWDLVITEELSRIYRNPRYQYCFVQDCVDAHTRIICIADNLDTAEDHWELMLGTAALRHGLVVTDTRRRVRRTASHSFLNGGMVQKYRFGYRKLGVAEANSGEYGPPGLRIAKLPECTPIIRQMRDRVLAGQNYVTIAEWLNELGVPPGPYCKSTLWTYKQVVGFLRDPILHGLRTFGDVRYETILGNGKKRRVKNASPETSFHPELAHLSVEEHQQLLEYMTQRNQPRANWQNPRRNVPRSRVIWPAQHARCAVCRELMHRYNGDNLKCQNAHRRQPEQCWNHVQLDGEVAREKIVDWLFKNYLDPNPNLRQALLDAVWEELQRVQQRSGWLGEKLDLQIKELEQQATYLAKAIAMGGEMDVLVTQLAHIQKERVKAARKRAAQSETQLSTAAATSRQELNDRLQEQVLALARVSYEFGDLMRQVLPVFWIEPVQALDSGLVRPRGRLVFRPDALMDSSQPPDQSAATELVVDLFDPPEHIKHLGACLREKRQNPRWGYVRIARSLGIGRMTVKRALAYARLMELAGTEAPYRQLNSRPEKASRWQPRPERLNEVAN
jgi:DNA invertase Pin-like site-specific DNA recombinase